MELRQFHNALRILLNIDRWELEEAGYIKTDVEKRSRKWEAFRSDPFRAFIQASDEDAEILWAIIERRNTT